MAVQRYTGMAIFFHWVIAAIIALSFPVGLIMGDLPVSPNRLKLFAYHKWAGITVLWLVFLRLAWRQFHPAPALPLTIPPWQKQASRIVQVILYGLMIAIPITGWLYSSAAGYSVIYLNLIQLPDFVEKSKGLADLLHEVHEWLNWVLLALVLTHALAALKHHWIDRDDVLKRMLPSRGGPS